MVPCTIMSITWAYTCIDSILDCIYLEPMEGFGFTICCHVPRFLAHIYIVTDELECHWTYSHKRDNIAGWIGSRLSSCMSTKSRCSSILYNVKNVQPDTLHCKDGGGLKTPFFGLTPLPWPVVVKWWFQCTKTRICYIVVDTNRLLSIQSLYGQILIPGLPTSDTVSGVKLLASGGSITLLSM